jgi:hypothetical protein
MIAIGIGLLVLLSVISIVLSDDEPLRADPRNDVRLWLRFVAR